MFQAMRKETGGGERDALARLYDRHGAGIFRFLRSLTGDEGGDEDEVLVGPTPDEIVVIEQLRNGQVDDTLRKLYADGSVR